MAFTIAKDYLDERGYGDRVMVFDTSSATVELAAQAVGTEPGKIAKSLTFLVEDKAVMILFAGDARVDNGKFKKTFATKAKMLSAQEVEEKIGHAVGGVCPFGIKDGVSVYLDESLRKYDEVFPACGSDNSAVRLTVEELERLSQSKGWINVSKEPEDGV